jgi:hypothetical protein
MSQQANAKNMQSILKQAAGKQQIDYYPVRPCCASSK